MPSADERAETQAAFNALEVKLEALNVKPKVVLTVPTAISCHTTSKCEPNVRGAFRVFLDPPLGGNWWGPSNLWIDDEQAFWIVDALAKRMVGYSDDRKVKGEVRNIASSLILTHRIAVAGASAFAVGGIQEDATALYRLPMGSADEALAQVASLEGKGKLLRLGPDDGRVLATKLADGWSTSLVDAAGNVSEPTALVINGRKLNLECPKREEGDSTSLATLFIDDKAHPLPWCYAPLFFSQTGEIYLTDEGHVWKLNAEGHLIGGAVVPAPVLEGDWHGRVGAGPDGTIYAWIPKRHSIDFVRLELTPR